METRQTTITLPVETLEAMKQKGSISGEVRRGLRAIGYPVPDVRAGNPALAKQSTRSISTDPAVYAKAIPGTEKTGQFVDENFGDYWFATLDGVPVALRGEPSFWPTQAEALAAAERFKAKCIDRLTREALERVDEMDHAQRGEGEDV